jgi:hypothetical protein
LLNLLVLPALAKRFSYRESRRKLRAAAREQYASEGNLAE